MNIWPLNNISQEEKNDILSKHKTLYNGYQTMQTSTPNTQPLYVQDFAGDKEGMVINNKGVVKKYTNYRINESDEKQMCSECGGQMMEGECMECGTQYEGECLDCVEEDLNPDDGFDYLEDSSNDLNTFEFEEMESAWHDLDDEKFEGEIGEWVAPLARAAASGAGAALVNRMFDEGDEYDEEYDLEEYDEEYEGEVDEWVAPLSRAAASGAALVNRAFDEEIDADLKESFKSEKMKIVEMMNRMNFFN
jgi:hypothetical protein